MHPAFLNLYHSVSRVPEYKFDTVNRILQTEPYSARLKEKGIEDFTATRRGTTEWYMEFDSREDYIAFLVKWS